MVPDEVSVHCPHCGKYTAVTPAPLVVAVPDDRSLTRVSLEPVNRALTSPPFYSSQSGRWWLGKCNACQEPLLVNGRGHAFLPSPQPGPVSEDIPEPIRSDLREAKLCFAAGAWNAAVVMARRSLQCATVEQGAPTGTQWPLWKQIAWLAENGKLTLAQRQLADAARWVGNHGAHDTEPDAAAGKPVITEVTQEDAADTIRLVEHLFETLYVTRTLAEAQLDKRGKSGGGPKK